VARRTPSRHLLALLVGKKLLFTRLSFIDAAPLKDASS
jgi:hypothetical protein